MSFIIKIATLFLFSCLSMAAGFNPKFGVKNLANTATAVAAAAKGSSKKKNDMVVIEKDYKVAAGFGIAAAVALSQQNLLAGVPLSALTALLAIQTGKVKFVFDDEAMEVFVAKKGDTGEETFASRENFAVGGQNRWKYSTFLKWSFIPSKEVPVFMYFTESQTDPQKPGGQFHLFPVIMNSKQLYDQLMLRVGEK
jgi:hypothetical protein